MRIWRSHFFGLIIILSILWCQNAFAKNLEYDGQTWEVGTHEGSDARVEKYLGREALYLKRNLARLIAPDFRDMVIEYEYASTHPSGFIGVNFRANEETSSLEQFYTRPHQSGQPDSTQYMVMINGVATWQLHAGPNETEAIDLPYAKWVKVKIVAIGEKADIFVDDMEAPVIHVPELRYKNGQGQTAFYASDRSWMKETGAYFSNISVRQAAKNDVIIGAPKDLEALPTGLVKSYSVSQPFKEGQFDSQFSLSANDLKDIVWTGLKVENDGVANLARVSPIKDEKNTVLVKFKLKGMKGASKLVSFGYSDRVKMFVDGQMIFAGNAKWRARDHRFLGTVALADSIPVYFKNDEIEIIAIVSESFGGWGFKAALLD